MKNSFAKLCFVIILFSISGFTKAESLAPDFIVEDTDGVEHRLYNYLQQGKSVILNFSSTWCKPCWNYKQSGVLDDLWNSHGPDGSDEVVILFLEADINTCEDCLYGQEKCNDFTYGDWSSSAYPATNLEGSNRSILGIYNVKKFPSIYAISAKDRSVKEMGQLSVAKWENWLQNQQSFAIAKRNTISAPEKIEKRIVMPSYPEANESFFIGRNEPKTQKTENNFEPVSLDIYPNPCSEKIHVEFSQNLVNSVDISLYNMQGRLYARQNLRPESRHVYMDISNFKGGAYFVVINTGRQVQSKKILILR